MRCLAFIMSIIVLIDNVHNARILGLFAHTGKSHFMFFQPLLKKLSEQGHHVTVASFFPMKNPPFNYTDVNLEGIAEIGVETFDLSYFESPQLTHRIPIVGDVLRQIETVHPFAEMALDICSKAVKWPPLVEALKQPYDVVLVEAFTSDCMLGLLHVYGIKAPTIALSSSNLVPWSLNRVGLQNNPSYLPVPTSPLTSRMSFVEKIQNTILTCYFYTWFHYAIQSKEKEIIEKHYGIEVPLYEISLNTTMIMVNTFHSLQGVRPIVPGLVEVGGMHLDLTKKTIPQVCQHFTAQMEANSNLALILGHLYNISTQ